MGINACWSLQGKFYPEVGCSSCSMNIVMLKNAIAITSKERNLGSNCQEEVTSFSPFFCSGLLKYLTIFIVSKYLTILFPVN